MAKAKKPAKPKQAISKVEQKRRQLISNAANKSLAQQEREKAQLKQAKFDARVQSAYEKEYARVQTAMAKQQARADALKESAKRLPSPRHISKSS